MRYQALVPLSLPVDDASQLPHNELTGEYISFILNNPLLQGYEQHIEKLTYEIGHRDDKY